MRNSICSTLLFSLFYLPPAAALETELVPKTAVAESYTSPYNDTLFADWNGTRNAMLTQGYDLRVTYKLDFLNNTSRNKDKIYSLDNLDIKLGVDLGKAAGIQGTSAFVHVLSNRGDKPGAHSNRLPHGVDNIETPQNGNTTKIFQAWLQQLFLDERVSVLAGLYDLNSEFYATESSAMFTHPTFGIGAEMAGTGVNGPSIFPTTSFGIRLKTIPAPGYYLQAVTLDGVPGDPTNPQGTHVQFNAGDGLLNVFEGGLPLGAADKAHNNKLSVGMWQYTTRFDDILDTDASGNPVQRTSHGAYALIEKVLKYQTDSDNSLISGFFRIGKTESNTTQFDRAMSTGLLFTGLFSGREEDELGLGYAQERNSEKYRIASGNTVHSEKSYELGYRYRATAGFVIQPFVQYLKNHSEDTSQDKTWWLGIRLEASL